LADGLSRRIVTPEQIDALANMLTEEPQLTIEQAVERLSLKPATEEEISLLIKQQLKSQDLTKLQKDETYKKIMIPRIVGAVLKAVHYSVEGKKVAEQVHALIRKGR